MAVQNIFQGANCTWWDTIDKVKIGPNNSLGCPSCGGLVFDQGTDNSWWKKIDKKNLEVDYDYKEFMIWLRGRCIAQGMDYALRMWRFIIADTMITFFKSLGA